jgi:outer membrane murein-binding lipoprotein Lpp
MNDSTKGYKVTIALLVVALLVVGGVAITRKGGGDDENNKRINECTTKLEECTSQRADLRNQVDKLKVDLKLAQDQANRAVVSEGQVIQASARPPTDGRVALTRDQILKVTAQTGGMKACYERGLKRDSGLQGRPIKVVFRFDIQPSGGANNTTVESDTHIDSQLVECFKQSVGRWRFPAFAGSPIAVEHAQPFQPSDVR